MCVQRGADIGKDNVLRQAQRDVRHWKIPRTQPGNCIGLAGQKRHSRPLAQAQQRAAFLPDFQPEILPADQHFCTRGASGSSSSNSATRFKAANDYRIANIGFANNLKAMSLQQFTHTRRGGITNVFANIRRDLAACITTVAVGIANQTYMTNPRARRVNERINPVAKIVDHPAGNQGFKSVNQRGIGKGNSQEHLDMAHARLLVAHKVSNSRAVSWRRGVTSIARTGSASYVQGMPRYAFRIEYDGAPFSGWQRQKEHPSVQGALEAALAQLEPNRPLLAAAGRTDAGVHASGQVAHCDMARVWDPFRLSEAVNFHLKPAPVAVVACARVEDDFHARFLAKERRYMYRLFTRRAPLTYESGLAWRVGYTLDVHAMQAAADRLLGTHDFTTFRSTSCQAKSPVKTLDHLQIEKIALPNGCEIRFHVRARSFLHNQVRSIVGTLERVGTGAWTPDDVRAALQACDRAACGPVAPPQGLYLVGVGYDSDPFVRKNS